MPKIKCLLVDDHTLFRQGVRRLLESETDFEVVGEAADGGEAVEKARELRPDIVLMDIGMPGLSSFESARQIKKNRMETKILFLTMYEDEDYLVQCLEVGASGYVLKDTPAPQLLTAVKDVYKGGKYLSSQVLGKLVEDFRSRVRDTRMRPRISTLSDAKVTSSVNKSVRFDPPVFKTSANCLAISVWSAIFLPYGLVRLVAKYSHVSPTQAFWFAVDFRGTIAR